MATKYYRELHCPYCGESKTFESAGCCGESGAHFQWRWMNEDTDEEATGDEILKNNLDDPNEDC